MSAPTAPAEVTGIRPATTRVTILTGNRMTDLALPSAAPMETYVDDTVAMLSDMLGDVADGDLADFDFLTQGEWAFARPGAPPLRPNESLDEAGVVDGSLLTLLTVSHTERYRPLVEDVIDAMAVPDDAPEFDRTAIGRFSTVATPLFTAAATAVAAVAWWDTGRAIWWPLALSVLAMLLLAGSFIAARADDNAVFAEALLIAAVPPLAIAAALAVPPPAGAAPLGAPQLAGAAGAVLVLTLVTRGGPRRRIGLATFTVITLTAMLLVATAFGFDWQRWVPAGAILLGFFIVTNAAKLTVAVARISLPPVPTPGETIDPEDLGNPVASHRAERDHAVPHAWQVVLASVPDSAARLHERTALARTLLNGFVAAGSLVLAVGAVAAVVRGHFFVHTLVLAGLLTVMCGFRSRLYAERWCAWSLMAAAVVIPFGVVAKLCHWYPHLAWMLLAGLLVTVLLTLAIVAATAGVKRISPVTKRILELLDGAVVIAILPMLMWVMSIYDIVRNLHF